MAEPEINACDVAQPAPEREANVYRHLRDSLVRVHCSAKRGHKCCGRITIDREHITLNCPLCGDARQLI